MIRSLRAFRDESVVGRLQGGHISIVVERNGAKLLLQGSGERSTGDGPEGKAEEGLDAASPAGRTAAPAGLACFSDRPLGSPQAGRERPS